MGFSTLLDVISSMIIGGMLLSIVLRLSDRATEKTYNNSCELSLQQNLSTIARMIEYDFKKIGYCADWTKIPVPSRSILTADISKLKFLTDVDKNGELDSIYYYLGPTSELLNTSNPRDRILYRVVNNELPSESNVGITDFHMVYFDALGDTINYPILIPGEISSIEVNITVENVAAYDTAYSSAFWRQIKLVARNLKKR
jgi:type II secretory pathway component PulJ